MDVIINDLRELSSTAAKLLATFPHARVFLFEGSMGAGKTTFIKSLCEIIGVDTPTSSPTFSIVNEYDSPQGVVYHFDFYRIKDEQEAFDLGYEEYFYSGKYCFIEWPQKINNLLPHNAVLVQITAIDQDQRQLKAQLI